MITPEPNYFGQEIASRYEDDYAGVSSPEALGPPK